MSASLDRELAAAIERGAESVARRYGRRTPVTFSKGRGAVEAVNADGTLDVAYQGAVLQSVLSTTACANVEVGDSVLVEFFDARAYATGVIATENVRYVNRIVAANGWASDIRATATNAWSVGSFSELHQPEDGTWSLDGGALVVPEPGFYLIHAYAIVGNCVEGDLCHVGAGPSTSSLLFDGQQNVNGAWSTIAVHEVADLSSGDLVYPMYKCEQGGGSRANVRITLVRLGPSSQQGS